MYSPEEEKAFEEVLADFANYIKNSPYLEIIRSPKFGYCKLVFNDPERWDENGELKRFQNSAELLAGIYDEILADVRDLDMDGDHEINQLSRKEAEEICRRVDVLIKHAKGKQKYYMSHLEEFLEDYQREWE